MKFLLKLVLVLIVAVGLALLVKQDTGYIYFAYGKDEGEVALSLVLLVIFIMYFLVNRLAGLLKGLWNLTGNVQHWNRQRRVRLAAASYHRAMLALAEGRWKYAEREFVKHARFAEMPMINYLYAARAAQHAGDIEDRDRYLRIAADCDHNAELPVEITRAELHISQNQLEDALAILVQLRKQAPRNDHILRLLATLYQQLKDWNGLRDLMSDIRKRNILDEDKFAKLEQDLYTRLFEQAGRDRDISGLPQLWNSMPKRLRDNSRLLWLYASLMVANGEGRQIESLLRQAMKKQWDDRLVSLYSQIESDNPAKQLATIEALAEEHPDNAVLLLTLGKLGMQNKLWGKARLYFESAIGAGAGIEAYRELGALLEQMGESEAAMQCYRDGVKLAASKPLQTTG